jgi:uncharacterized coiled-coil protein SlyX
VEYPKRNAAIVLLASISGLAIAPGGYAQDANTQRIQELEKKLEQSLQTIQKLNDRVNTLENKLNKTPSQPSETTTAPSVSPTPGPSQAERQEAPAPSEAKRLEAIEKQVSEITQSQGAAPTDLGVPLHGFADVGAGKASSGAGENRANGFTFGTLSLYLTPQFGDRVKALIELAFEQTPEKGLATDLERVQLGYSFNDAATVWLGRFHTPFGYWNTAFHHGAQIQTAILRPKFIDFEDKGGIVPAHMVGTMLQGLVAAGRGKVVYNAYVANGSRIVDDALDPNVFRDDNSNKALGVNLGYRFGGSLAGLYLGVHGLTQEVDFYTPAHTRINRNRLNMLGGFAVYEHDAWEIISEYYAFRNKDLGGEGGSRSSWAGFAQAGYAFGDWTPFVRLEKASLDQNDNYFLNQASGRSYARGALGIRYFINEQSAIKLEANRTRQPEVENGDFNEALFQYSIRF